MRLFIAIDVPQALKNYLREMQKNLPPADFSLTHDFHLTLKFLGECSEKKKEEIEESLIHLPSFSPFQMTLGSLGTFGGSSPRVIWVSLKGPPRLKEFATAIEKKMERLKFPMEHRFMPHITLARVKKIDNPKVFLKILKTIPVTPYRFLVSHYYLFQSELHRRKGAVHTKLLRF